MNFRNANVDYYAVGMVVWHNGVKKEVVSVTNKGSALAIYNSHPGTTCDWLFPDERGNLTLDLDSVWLGRKYLSGSNTTNVLTVVVIGPDLIVLEPSTKCDWLFTLKRGNLIVLEPSTKCDWLFTLKRGNLKDYTPVPLDLPKKAETPVRVGDVLMYDGHIGQVYEVEDDHFHLRALDEPEGGTIPYTLLFTDNFTKYVPYNKE